jgi:hypothetical protein
MSILHYMILFVLLQPGLLLTLPAVGRRVFMSGKMSVQAVMVHAVVFGVVLYFLRRGRYFEGFYAGPVAPAKVVVDETKQFAKELGAPTIALARLNAIDTRVNTQLANLKASVKSLEATQAKYVGKPVPASAKASLDAGAADLAKKKAEIALYQPIADMIVKKRAQLAEMAKKTVASVSASLPPTVKSMVPSISIAMKSSSMPSMPSMTLMKSSSMPSMPSMTLMQSSSMPSMPSMTLMKSSSMPSMPSMAPMKSSSMPSGSMSLSYAKYLASKYGF